MSTEFARTSNWMGAIASPEVAKSLSPTSGETDAMLFGRVAGDVITIVLGAVEVSGGATIAGGGVVVGCGLALCITSAPALVTGAAVATYGIGTTVSGAAGLGENLGALFSRKDESSKSKPFGSGSGQTRTFKGYDVRVDWESPGGSNGNVHVTLNGEKITITDPKDLSSLPKSLQDNNWLKNQIQRAYDQMTQYESSNQ